jgi:hypothetical protein
MDNLLTELQAGRVSVAHDRNNPKSIGYLRLLLKAAFPDDTNIPVGSAKYYFARREDGRTSWEASNYCKITTRPIWMFPKDELLESIVRNNNILSAPVGHTVDTTDQFLTRSQVKRIADIACPTWKVKLEQYLMQYMYADRIPFSEDMVRKMFEASNKDQLVHIELLFSRPKSLVDLKELSFTVRMSGKFAQRSFWLSPQVNWSIEKDDRGELCLVPTKR